MKSIYRSIDNSMHPKVCIHGIGFRAAHGLCAFCPFKNGADAEKFYDSEISNNDPIPCSHPNSWEDGKEYEEGKDYELMEDYSPEKKFHFVVRPLSSNDEDELDGEFRMILSHAFLGCDTSDISRETWDLAISECVKYVTSLSSQHEQEIKELKEGIIRLEYLSHGHIAPYNLGDMGEVLSTIKALSKLVSRDTNVQASVATEAQIKSITEQHQQRYEEIYEHNKKLLRQRDELEKEIDGLRSEITYLQSRVNYYE